MKLYISYFYQIRFFTRNMLPLSTALWDPKWYHDFKDSSFVFKDKRGIYNGLIERRLIHDDSCRGLCSGRKNCQYTPESCLFLNNHRLQLFNLDFDSFIKDMENLANNFKIREGFEEEPIICFIVYETPDNPCSERVIIQEWFFHNGYELPEWNKNIG